LRGYSVALRSLGLYDEVVRRLPAPLRETLETPPPASVWVDFDVCLQVMKVVMQLRGVSGVRRFGHDSVLAGVAPFMQSFIQGLLRLFGVSPVTILNHMGKIAGQTTRGGEYSYQATSERAGVLTMTVPGARDLDASVWHSSAGGFLIVFEVCGVEGDVGEPEVVPDGLGNAARFAVSWQPRG
jgi:hypothetical protein